MDAELGDARENKRMEDKRQISRRFRPKTGPVHMLDESEGHPDKLNLELEEHKGQIRLVGIASTDPEIASCPSVGAVSLFRWRIHQLYRTNRSLGREGEEVHHHSCSLWSTLNPPPTIQH